MVPDLTRNRKKLKATYGSTVQKRIKIIIEHNVQGIDKYNLHCVLNKMFITSVCFEYTL